MLFAGGTVIIALLSLRVAGIPLVTTLGYTSAIVVFVAVARRAVTLLPALLGAARPARQRAAPAGLKHPARRRPHGWQRWARFVADHPWPAMVVAS